MNDDAETAEVLKLLKRAGVTLHVRGNDSRQVIELKSKYSGNVVGWVEFKKRLQACLIF